MPKRVTEESIRRRQAECARVKFLLEHWWNGNQSRMADDLGVTQSLVSKIVRATQGPGREFLSLLSRQSGLNPSWVLHGEGEPLLAPTRGTLPVSVSVLPGSPLRYSHLLTGNRHMVAEPMERDTRYWLQVLESSSLVKVSAWKIMPNDLLLMETTADWIQRLDLVLGRFCGVHLRTGSPMPFEIGLMQRDEWGIGLRTERVIGRLIEPVEPVPSPVTTPPEPVLPEPKSSSSETERIGKVRRQVLNLDKEREAAPARRAQREQREAERRRLEQEREQREAERRRLEQQAQERGEVCFAIEAIVCVCFYLVRPTLGSS